MFTNAASRCGIFVFYVLSSGGAMKLQLRRTLGVVGRGLCIFTFIKIVIAMIR
jgi:hypothetical protein